LADKSHSGKRQNAALIFHDDLRSATTHFAAVFNVELATLVAFAPYSGADEKQSVNKPFDIIDGHRDGSQFLFQAFVGIRAIGQGPGFDFCLPPGLQVAFRPCGGQCLGQKLRLLVSLKTTKCFG
jgi:hypothetical protein